MKTLNVLLSSALISLVSGCASSERMIRISPLGEKNSLEGCKIENRSERVNTWPLLYAANDRTSILWPMADIDKQGWAVRPFFNKDGHEYSILFPLCAWNPEKGDGWVLNTYWNDKTRGALPFFHEKKGNYTYLFPAIWNDRYFLLMPLLYHSNDFAYAGPLWMHSGKDAADKSGETVNNSYGMGPFWWNCKSGSLDSGGFWPMFFASEEKSWFFPLYLYRNNDSRRLLMTPFASAKFDKAQNEYSMLNLLGPLFIYDNDENSETWTFLFPFSYCDSSKKKKDDIFYVFPYYQREMEKEHINFLLPFYSYRKKSDMRKLLFPILLTAYSEDKISTRYNVLFPLFRLKKGENSDNEFSFWPLFSYHDEKFSLLNLNRDGFSILGPLIFKYAGSSRVKGTSPSAIARKFDALCGNDNGKLNSLSYNLLLLNFFEEKERRKELLPYNNTVYSKKFLSFIFWSSSERVRSIKTNDKLAKKDIEEIHKIEIPEISLKRKNKIDHMIEKNKKLAEILKKYDCYKGDSEEELGEGLYLMDCKFTTETASSQSLIPLFYNHKTENEKSNGNVLFFLSRWKSEGDKSRFSILEYFYRNESDGKNSYNDIFPFLNYDSGEDIFRVSFLWRLVSYKKDKAETKFHLFFIPLHSSAADQP